ncbi:Flavonoid 3'-monooxygenase [Linum grandiflorum]
MSHLQNTLPHFPVMESWCWEVSSLGSQQVELVVAALVVVSILVIWLILRRATYETFPPGPRGLPIVGYLPFLSTELHKSFTELAGVYGPVYKLWLGSKMYVVISSPRLAKQVREQVTFSDRDPLIASKIISYGGNDIAFCSHGPDWRKLRKVFVRELLCNARLESSYVLRKREVEKAVKDVYQKRGKALDFGQLVFMTVSNTVLSMLMGCTVHGEEGATFFSKIRELVDEFNELQSTPNISDLIPALARFDLQGIEKKTRQAHQSFDRILSFIINERRKLVEVKETKDFLQILLDLKSDGDAALSITDDQLKGILVDTIIGGTDTTATSIEWAMAMLMQHPDAMQKIYRELDEVVGRSSFVEELHLPKLQYLDAVVKETLRLHPAVPMLAMRCPSQDCKLSDYTIPKGVTVIINAYAIHRDPQLWTRPLEFRPERFLEGNAAKFDYLGNSSQYFPFGTGRRVCAGLPMAEKMLKYVLASLLHSFEWRLAHGTEVDLTDKFGIVLKLKKPLILVPMTKLTNPDLY